MSATLNLIKAYNTLYSFNPPGGLPESLPAYKHGAPPPAAPIIKRWTFPGGFGGFPAPGPGDLFALDPDPNADDTSPLNAQAIQDFTSMQDSSVLENCIGFHWYQLIYNITAPGVQPENKFPPYHLMFAYLIENSRIVAIFERLILKFLTTEDLGHASPFTYHWIRNTAALFYKDVHVPQFRSLVTAITPNFDAIRRNAYYRLLGLELGHGNQDNSPVVFIKPAQANTQFVQLLENFLREVWQGIINNRNTSGVNTTDVVYLSELALQLKDSMLSRRNSDKDLNLYENSSLSREEYLSVIMAEWYYQVIATNTDMMKELNTEAVKPAERLANIGKLVGITPHSKTHDLYELAPLLARLLRTLEEGFYDNPLIIQNLFDPTVSGTFAAEISLIISLWQKTTGTNLKQMPNAAYQNGVKPPQRTIELT